MSRRGLVGLAEIEVKRCRRAVEKGSPVAFWLRRLGSWADELEAAATLLRAQLAQLAASRRCPDCEQAAADLAAVLVALLAHRADLPEATREAAGRAARRMGVGEEESA